MSSSQRFVRALRNWAVRYYVAVQLNAAAVTPELFRMGQMDEPVPIIRPYSNKAGHVWDPRELVAIRDEVGVLTVPVDRAGPSQLHAIRNN